MNRKTETIELSMSEARAILGMVAIAQSGDLSNGDYANWTQSERDCLDGLTDKALRVIGKIELRRLTRSRG